MGLLRAELDAMDEMMDDFPETEEIPTVILPFAEEIAEEGTEPRIRLDENGATDEA